MRFLKQYFAFRHQLREEFFAIVGDLLHCDSVRMLDLQRQHLKYTRLRHSMSVAWRAFFLARLFGWQTSASVARAGLLHDFFFLDETQRSGELMRSHPKIAVENARSVTELSALEEDIILHHMFFVNFTPPSHKEGVLVIAMDNVCCLAELVISLFSAKDVISAYEEAPAPVAVLD